jgi:ketosteroid isomerase-like protein
MKKQEDAWNRGDLEGFMQGYWKSDSLRFIGKRGITYGWQQTLDNYKKGYPNTEAMGTLQFTNLSLELTGDSSAYVIGQWQLFRTADTLSGHYSLLWKMKNNQWLIVADHSS